MEKLQAPAVHSAKIALKEAIKMKSFMHEKVAAGQIQAQINQQLRQQKAEEAAKAKEDKIKDERKITEKVFKDNKEKATDSLIGLLKK